MDEKLIGIIKNYDEWKKFEKEFNLGTLSHSFLIINKDIEVCEAFAKKACELMCGKGSAQNCDVCVYGNGTNGSFLTDDVKTFIEKTNYKPVFSENKAFVIDGGELSNIVQNKILKTIEEPPKKTYIFILGKSLNNYLQTILSRCTKIILPDLNLADFKTLGLNEELFSKSGGSYHFAKKFEDRRFTNKYNLVIDCLENMQKSADVVLFSRKLTKEKGEFGEILEIFENVFSTMMHLKMNNKKFYNAKIDEDFTLKSLAFCFELLLNATNMFKSNCNVNAISDMLLLNILEVKYKCKKDLL